MLLLYHHLRNKTFGCIHYGSILCVVFGCWCCCLSVILKCQQTQAFSPTRDRRKQPITNTRLAVPRKDDVHGDGDDDESIASVRLFYDPNRIRYRCRVSYDGYGFYGFQIQGGKNNKKRTVQGEIETVLSQRFQRSVQVVGAGRTDRGVHACGQAIHFDLYPNEIKAKTTTRKTINNDGNITITEDNNGTFEPNLERCINRMLVPDIQIWNLGQAPPPAKVKNISKYSPDGIYNWNSNRSCTQKLYSYRICIKPSMHPLDRYNRFHILNPSDRFNRWHLPWTTRTTEKLERILKLYEGEHDFVCFAGSLEQQEKKTGIIGSTIRTIHKVQLVREFKNNIAGHIDVDNNNNNFDGCHGYIRIDIYLTGALYKMVRNLIGTAIDVCRNKVDEKHFSDLLHRPRALELNRNDNPSKPVPAYGLTLERVFYPDNELF